ncbi:MAG: hypothetical protein HY327_13480 [Chloroflexi bacterium]|nr:hypothetical protein [Chloroflexota bacterium]
MEQTITLQLPDEVLRRYQRGATAARKVLEEFLADRLADLAPPSVDNLPSPLREELRDLERVSDTALRQVVQSRLPTPRQRTYSRLLRKQSQGALSTREKETLRHLGEQARQITLRKAHALMLLKWRGIVISPAEAQLSSE